MPISRALACLLAAAAAAAAPGGSSQPAFVPQVSHYWDAGRHVELVLPDPLRGGKPVLTVHSHPGSLGGRPYRVKTATYRWDRVGRVAIPSRALLSEETRAVVLLGVFGDSNVGLGQIEVRSFEGRVLADFDLRVELPDLEKDSAAWSEARGAGPGPRPWIVDARLLPDGAIVKMDVVGGSRVELNLRRLTAKIERGLPKP
jgi:hypothetical protein